MTETTTRERTGMIVRSLAQRAMGLKDGTHVDEMFPDLFDLDHEETFDALCASIERAFGIPELTAAELEDAYEIEQFIDAVHNAALRALANPSGEGR